MGAAGRAFGLILGLALGSAARAEPPAIAAASDLQFVLPALAADFGRALNPTLGSSGMLARQIARGAPFQLLLSADDSHARFAVESGRAEGPPRDYARGRLALVVARNAAIALDPTLASLGRELAARGGAKFAIANPEHAPYGRAAVEALSGAGLWPALRSRLVLGENVAQAARFVQSGAAAAGLVALAVARGAGLEHAALPASMHGALRQQVVVVKGAGADARAFADYLVSDRARAILTANGFDPP
ncbi:MAG: molybdate ABC transporter substrate-binding protein [Alphaproteobacteria bacterium]|nr:molybdate ABC transporter substrate-binding protein [Alphaproteobacteria bacterium]